MKKNVLHASALLLLIATFGQSLSIAQDNAATQSAADNSKVHSVAGSLDGVTFTVNPLKRNTNGTLTLSLKIQGTQGKPVRRDSIGFSGESPWSEYFSLLDMANKKRYAILEDSNGHCLCTHLTDEEIADIGAGKAKNVNIKFPLPPADVAAITVELPHAEPIDDVPITN